MLYWKCAGKKLSGETILDSFGRSGGWARLLMVSMWVQRSSAEILHKETRQVEPEEGNMRSSVLPKGVLKKRMSKFSISREIFSVDKVNEVLLI